MFKTLLLVASAVFLASIAVSADTETNLRGLSNPVPQIVGGTEAPKFKYTKWMVGLLSGSRSLPFCGASYIGKNLVLTAAHCVVDFKNNPSGYRAEANRHNWRDTTEQGIRMPITKVFVHPSYNAQTSANDIALLQVTNGPDLALWPELDSGSSSSEAAARIFKIIGWGTTSSGGSQSVFLRQALVNLIPTRQCGDLYQNPSLIYPSMICAKGNGIDTCQGDSGGPMFVESGDASPVTIVGLTSWGYGCAGVEPGVYTRVSYLRSFIDRTVGCATGTTYTGGKCK